MLGELLTRLDDPAVAAETLLSLDDLALVARVQEAAARAGLETGQFAAASIGRFVSSAGDEDWVGLVGAVSGADDPAAAFLRRVLTRDVG